MVHRRTLFARLISATLQGRGIDQYTRNERGDRSRNARVVVPRVWCVRLECLHTVRNEGGWLALGFACACLSTLSAWGNGSAVVLKRAATPFRLQAGLRQTFCSLRRISCSSSSFCCSSMASFICSSRARCHSVYLLINSPSTEVTEVIREMIRARLP